MKKGVIVLFLILSIFFIANDHSFKNYYAKIDKK